MSITDTTISPEVEMARRKQIDSLRRAAYRSATLSEAYGQEPNDPELNAALTFERSLWIDVAAAPMLIGICHVPGHKFGADYQFIGLPRDEVGRPMRGATKWRPMAVPPDE